MRLTLSLFFVGLVLAVPAVLVVNVFSEQEARIQTAASRIGTGFVWPDIPAVADSKTALRILTRAADATDSNVLRTSVEAIDSGRTRITHYVLMGRDRSRLFDQFDLAEGRWLTPTESRTGLATVSSAQTDESVNVGVPRIFGDEYELNFAALRQSFDSAPSTGRYVVEAPSDAAERFIEIVNEGLIEAGATGITFEDLTPIHRPGTTGNEFRLHILASILAGTAVIVVAFIPLREGKRIGVLRLMGNSQIRVWYLVVGRLQFLSVLGTIIAYSAFTFTLTGSGTELLRELAFASAEIAFVGFAATLGIGLAIIQRIKITDLIKGRLQ